MNEKQIKNKAFDDLKRFEGLKLKPYKCTEGKLTIGYGRNLEDKGIEEHEAEMMLMHDINTAYDQAVSLVSDQNQDVTLIITQMIFQLGLAGVKQFKNMLSAIKAKDYQKASKEMLDSLWAIQTPVRAKYLSNLMKAVK